MLYLLVPSRATILFNVFRYLTFRSSWLITGHLAGRRPWLGGGSARCRTAGNHRETPERHRLKKGTPTMGGVLIVSAIAISTLLWANLRNRYVWVVVLTALGFSLIGVWDDWRKLRRRKGLSARLKFGLQLLLALVMVGVVFWEPARDGWQPVLASPFLKGWLVHLGWWWIPFAVLVVVGASNAVNLTDGLDGLAIGPVIMAGGAFGVIAWLTGNFKADYLRSQRQGGGRADGVLRGLIGGHRIPVVQLPSGRGVHGRRRVPGPRRLHRHALRAHQVRAAAAAHRRPLRGGGGVGHDPGRGLQAHGQARLQDGPAAPSLRAVRLVGAPDRRALLDRGFALALALTTLKLRWHA
jgi:hypothetical protein